MNSIYLDAAQISERTARNEAFWRGALRDYPLLWVTAPDPKPGCKLRAPATEEELWTDVEYVVKAADHRLAQTYFAGDSLPVYTPWLGPDQFAAWLGAELHLKPRDNTSWVSPFVEDWTLHPELEINPQNRWWKLYLALLAASAEFGSGKWITGYPDLHSGIDALCAIRGPASLMMDLINCPEIVQRQMKQMTRLWKDVIDSVSRVITPFGQGTSNWTMGYSSKRFVCIGQNDFSCLISPGMFDEFCLTDIVATCRHVDFSLYHLDGPEAIRHVTSLLKIKELGAIQWIPGATNPPPGQWLDLFRRIQEGGKSVQARYPRRPDLNTSETLEDLETLLRNIEVTKLFLWIDARDRAEADAVVEFVKRVCDRKRRSSVESGGGAATLR